MAISPQRLTIYLYSAHRAVIFAIAQLSCLLHDCCIKTYTNLPSVHVVRHCMVLWFTVTKGQCSL